MELVQVLEGHEEERVWHACFSPASTSHLLLATCGADKTVRIWAASIADAASGASTAQKWRCVSVLEEIQSRTIRACEFSPNGRYLACASFDATTVIWELQNHEELLKAANGPQQASKSASASSVADTGSVDGNFSLKWNIVATLEGHENEVKSVSWSASGSLLATCSRDKSVWIWDTSSTTGEKPISSASAATRDVDDEDMDDDDEDDGGGGKGRGSFECVSVLPGHSQDVKFVRWHPYEDILLSCSYDDTIRIWMEGVNDWFTASTLTGHANTVWGASFDETGNRFASCSQDCTVIIWGRNTRTGDGALGEDDDDFGAVQGTPLWEATQVLENLHSRTIFSVDWAKTKSSGTQQQLIATAGADDCICIIGGNQSIPQKFELLYRLEHAHDSDVNCVRWHPIIPGLLVSTGDDGLVKIWRR
jgi:WD40 repeat protein